MITERKKGNLWGWWCVYVGHKADYGQQSTGGTIHTWWRCSRCKEECSGKMKDYMSEYLNGRTS